MSTFSNNNCCNPCDPCGSIAGIQGDPGPRGTDGLTPNIGKDGNWWIGPQNTGIRARGPQGKQGIPGPQGHSVTGPAGANGKGVVQVNNQFMTTSVMTQPSEDDSKWQPTIMGLLINEMNRFLWRKENTIYSDGSTSYAIMLIAVMGAAGTGFNIIGTLTDTSELPPSGTAGQAYVIDGLLYVWVSATNSWEVLDFTGPQGEPGIDGIDGISPVVTIQLVNTVFYIVRNIPLSDGRDTFLSLGEFSSKAEAFSAVLLAPNPWVVCSLYLDSGILRAVVVDYLLNPGLIIGDTNVITGGVVSNINVQEAVFWIQSGVASIIPGDDELRWFINGVDTGVRAEGIDGKNGEDGKDGTSLKIVGYFNTLLELETAYPSGPDNPGDMFIVGGFLYIWEDD